MSRLPLPYLLIFSLVLLVLLVPIEAVTIARLKEGIAHAQSAAVEAPKVEAVDVDVDVDVDVAASSLLPISLKNLPLTGGKAGKHPTFTGTFLPQTFKVVKGKLFVSGLLKGQVKNGNVVSPISQTITLPTIIITARCNLLVVVLGPLVVNLPSLGLFLDLPLLSLIVTPKSVLGNLLGPLLCDLAQLTDAVTLDLALIVQTLNRILAQLLG